MVSFTVIMKRSGTVALLLLAFALFLVSCNETDQVTTSGSLKMHGNLNIEQVPDVEETARIEALIKAKKRASDVHKKMKENRTIKHEESYGHIDDVEELQVMGEAVRDKTTEDEVVEGKIRASEVVSETEGKEKEGRIFCGDNQNTYSALPPEPFVSAEGIESNGTSSMDNKTKCLKLSEDEDQPFLTFSQETAPSSNNALLTHIASLVNMHIECVVNVDISLMGNPKHAKVGKFMITAVITRIIQLENGSQDSVEECFEIPYEITDIDECSLPSSHPMSHNCHPSAQCVNVVGSHECSCRPGSWGVKGSGSIYPQKGVMLRLLEYMGWTQGSREKNGGSCGGKASTLECCYSAHCHDDPWICEKNCKSNFLCTSDPCLGVKCPRRSSCTPGMGYGDFHCTCKFGYKLVDGMCERDMPMSSDLCTNHSCPNNCQCIQSGAVYRCVPRPGYMEYTDPLAPLPPDAGVRRDTITACLSSSIPKLVLNGPQTLYFQQGDVYEEHGVTVVDENEEDGQRTVKIQYSHPIGPYFKHVGIYSILYSLEVPWLDAGLNFLVKRDVVVTDVDECSYTGPIEELHHNCAAEADCKNSYGSYTCECKEDYEGDGLKNGTGCTDITPPILHCIRKGCKVLKFKSCSCVGFVGLGERYIIADPLDKDSTWNFLNNVTQDMCNEGCFEAYDIVGSHITNLTTNIRRGALEMHDTIPNLYRIPFDVADKAGNNAETMYLMIEVEPVDIFSILEASVGEKRTVSFRSVFDIDHQATFSLLMALVALVILPKLLSFLRASYSAVKYLYVPRSLVDCREEFELGYNLILNLKGLGMLSENEKLRKTATAWARLIDTAASVAGLNNSKKG